MRRARVDHLLAALFCAGAAVAGAAELGTLFHTPEERARLDRLRRGDTTPSHAGPAEPDRPRELTGFVKRSDGHGTAFIDGEPVPVAPGNSRLLEPGAVRGYSERKSEGIKIERKGKS
jgi:hypothetical protein